MSEEIAHSDVVGGSSAKRVINCPGSVKLNQKVAHAHKTRILQQLNKEYGTEDAGDSLEDCGKAMLAKIEKIYREETTSPYAQEGTDLHSAMEFILENDEEPESVVDRTFGKTLITPTLYSEAIIPALHSFDDYLDEVYEEDGEDLQFLVERKGEIPGVPSGFGTADIVGKTSKRMVIWDWKFGAGVPVSPVENEQGLFYGRALAHTDAEWFAFPTDESGQFEKDLRVDIVIAQPRVGDGRAQVWTTTYGRLEEFRWVLVRAVGDALGDAPRFEGGSHCKWCEAKHICPLKQNIAGKILERMDAAKDDIVDDDGNDASMKDVVADMVADFTPEDLAEWLREGEELMEWIKGVKALAYSELDAGRDVPGKGLDQGLTNAQWTEDFATIDRALGRYGLEVKDRRDVSNISPTQARKLLKGDEKNAKLVEKYIDRRPGKVTMKDIDKVKNPVTPMKDRIAGLADKLKDDTTE